MDLAFKLFVYIILANILYTIVSLFKQGYKHYSGYIWQLICLSSFIVWMIVHDWNSGLVLIVSFVGVIVLVFIPIMLQRRIELLMAEGFFGDLETYAKLKAAIAWSGVNYHVRDIAIAAAACDGNNTQLENSIRGMLGQGEPYDHITKVFLGFLHFNNRNFDGLIRDLKIPDKSHDENSFDELIYLVRAYLETTRYDEAIDAQIALEKKIAAESDENNSVLGNAVINRMIFFSFLGWKKDFDSLISQYPDGLFGLPAPLVTFWKGVCLFNSGSFEEGESTMFSVIKAAAEVDENDPWLPFMRDRLRNMKDNREFFEHRILPLLQEQEQKYSPIINEIVRKTAEDSVKIEAETTGTNGVIWLTAIISIYVIFTSNVNDVIDLINSGVNSSFLVKHGEYFRLFTYMFIHAGYMHLFMNLFAVKYFAPVIETLIGRPLFLGIYFFSGIAGGIFASRFGHSMSLGASGAVMGLLGASIIYEIFMKQEISKINKRISLSTLVFILFINLAIGWLESDTIDNWAHIGGFLFGIGSSLLSIGIYKTKILKKLVSIAIVCLLLFIGILSVKDLYGNKVVDKLPYIFIKDNKLENAVSQEIGANFTLDIPASWKFVEGDKNIQSFIQGSFGEKLLYGAESIDNYDAFIVGHIDKQRNELEEIPECKLISRIGPENIKYDGGSTGSLIVWKLTIGDSPRCIAEYFINGGKEIMQFAFILPSSKWEYYKALSDSIVNSFRLVLKDKTDIK